MSSVKRDQWSKRFGVWFRQVLRNASVMDYRYPIKGCGVWLPYGFKIRRKVLGTLRDLLDSAGHEETLFPLLIPETSLAKEAGHVGSFEAQCLWVTRGGLEPLKVKYALRPTSETAIAPMLKLWIRSHADLPMRLYQIVNIFRYETRATRPILRMREVSTFKEAHTAHATREEAEAQVKTGVKIYKQFFDAMGVPYLTSRRPEWDKFPGALYSIAFDMICPDGRSLQIGTVHNLGQNFSKAFDISYETEDGEQRHIWQTCYGISGRGIASALIAHGDDHGLVLPPAIAPAQVVVVPVPYGGMEDTINSACEAATTRLKHANLSVELDLRPDLTPGSKFYYWELRGIPVRVEIGPRDVENNEATFVRRDTLTRQTCKTDELEDVVIGLLEKMTVDLKEKAWRWMRKHVYRVDDLSRAKQLLKDRAGVVEVFWCGRDECGRNLEEEINARVLGVPEDDEGEIDGHCILCGRKAVQLVRLAQAY